MSDSFDQPNEVNARPAPNDAEPHGAEKVILGFNQRKVVRVAMVLILLTAVSLAVGLGFALSGQKQSPDSLEATGTESSVTEHQQDRSQEPTLNPTQLRSSPPPGNTTFPPPIVLTSASTTNLSTLAPTIKTTVTLIPAATTQPSRVPTQYPTQLRSAPPSPSGIPTHPPSIVSSSTPTIHPSTPAPTGCPSFPAPPPLPGKRGIAFTMRDIGQEGSWVENLPYVVAVNPYWFYSWGPTIPEEAQIDGVEFVPVSIDLVANCVN
jgi:hypothetical protein